MNSTLESRKYSNNRGKQLQPRSALARIAKLTACVPFFPEFELVGHRSFEWRTLRNAQARARRWPSVSNPLRPDVFIHHPWVLIVTQTENLRARWRERGRNCSVFWLNDLRILLPPIPKGVVCQLHLHYGILIYFRFSMWVKRQSREPFGRLLREQSQILPIDSGESPPFLIDESPQFHAISCPP